MGCESRRVHVFGISMCWCECQRAGRLYLTLHTYGLSEDRESCGGQDDVAHPTLNKPRTAMVKVARQG